MCRLRRLAAFAAALALAGCGTAARGREAPAAPTAAAQAPMLEVALDKRTMAHAAQRLADALDQWFLRRQPVVDVRADR